MQPIAGLGRIDHASWKHATIGEIAVSGPVVTQTYFNRAAANQLAKIRDPATGEIWHRMGDVGYFDVEGRLWFCGRKSQRVVTSRGTLFTIPCEAVFNVAPRGDRSALGRRSRRWYGSGRSSALNSTCHLGRESMISPRLGMECLKTFELRRFSMRTLGRARPSWNIRVSQWPSGTTPRFFAKSSQSGRRKNSSGIAGSNAMNPYIFPQRSIH